MLTSMEKLGEVAVGEEVCAGYAAAKTTWTDVKQECDECTHTADHAEVWMAALHDDTLISDLTIPGTHDSAAYTSSLPFISTQTLDFRKQLDAGIRYFDLRCRLRKDVVEMVHGSYFLGLRLENVLSVMYAWLDAHPSEALIVQIKRDRKETNVSTKFPRAIVHVLLHNPSRWRTENTIPQLGSMRGRIQLLRRFSADGLGEFGIDVTEWQDNPTKPFTLYLPEDGQVTIQDHYSLVDPQPLPVLVRRKGRDVSRVLNRADLDPNRKHLYINFTSAFEFNARYQLSARDVALGGWWRSRWKIQWEDGMNIRLRSYLRSKKAERRRFGVVVMDFPDLGAKDLITALIRSNFESKVNRSGPTVHVLMIVLMLVTLILLLLALACAACWSLSCAGKAG